MKALAPVGRPAIVTATAVSTGVRPRARQSAKATAGIATSLTAAISAVSRQNEAADSPTSDAPRQNSATGGEAAPSISSVRRSGPGTGRPEAFQAMASSTATSTGLRATPVTVARSTRPIGAEAASPISIATVAMPMIATVCTPRIASSGGRPGWP